MKPITNENKNSFMEYYHNFHDSYIDDLKYDKNKSLVELIINVWWVGSPSIETNEIKENHEKKLKLLFKDISYFVENNPYYTDYIDDSSITFVRKDDKDYIHFAISTEDPDEEPIIYIIANTMEYEEIN